MRTKLIRIGNSRGVRIPKPLLEEAGLEEDVELRLTDAGIVVEKAGRPRAGWAEAAAALGESGDSGFLDGAVPTEFDEAEWVW